MRTPRATRGPGPKYGLFLVALAALLANWLVFLEFRDHPLLAPEGGLDSGVYRELALRVASGDVLLRSVREPFFVSPAYIYFAAPFVWLGAGSVSLVLVFQAILGAVAVWLVGDTARRLFGDRAALAAAVLLGLTGVVAFHQAAFLQAALDAFLAALALWLLVRAIGQAPRGRPFLAAGLALGVFALNRPNVLPWAFVVAALVAVARGLRGGARLSAAFLLGTFLGVAPATIRNVAVAGEPVLVSSHGGLNLLIGNGPGADGTYRWLDGITPSIAGQAADARRLAERERGRALSSREVSLHFAGRAWAWIAAEPASAARLFLRKLWYVFSGDEAPLNFSYPWYRDRSPVLKLLVVGPWLLVPLGFVGLVLAFCGTSPLPRKDLAVWASFVPAYAALVAMFFVATRYRIPLDAALATAAGGGAAALFEAVRKRDWRTTFLAVVVSVPSAALALWPTGLDDGRANEETEWILHSIEAGQDAGDVAKALATLEPVHPERGVLWFRVGQAWATVGRADEAIAAFRRSLAIDPRQKETERLLAAALERRALARALAGEARAAEEDLEAAVRLDATSASARLNLAAILAERGVHERARQLALDALVLRPGYERAEALLRALDSRRGR